MTCQEAERLSETTSREDWGIPAVEKLWNWASHLYGSDADLWTVIRRPETKPHSVDVRSLLRRECGIAQDPVTGVWFSLVRGSDLAEIAWPSLLSESGSGDRE